MKAILVFVGLVFSPAAFAVNPLAESIIAYEAILKSSAIDRITPGDGIQSIEEVQTEDRYRIQTNFGCEILVDVKFNELPPQFLGNRSVKEVSILNVSDNFRRGSEVFACKQ